MKPENKYPDCKENPVEIRIDSITISEEEYRKLIESEGKIRISITVKSNANSNKQIIFGKKREKDQYGLDITWTDGAYFEVTYAKVTTEEEVNKSREELMEWHEQQEQEKCRKCREEQ